jgi:hypothetical protein
MPVNAEYAKFIERAIFIDSIRLYLDSNNRKRFVVAFEKF